MSRDSYRARASASDSLSPASTLSRMCLASVLTGSALAHLFEDPVSRARLLGEEGVEDVVHHVMRDSAAGVAHLEHHADTLLGAGGAGGDREDAASLHRLDGV